MQFYDEERLGNTCGGVGAGKAGRKERKLYASLALSEDLEIIDETDQWRYGDTNIMGG